MPILAMAASSVTLVLDWGNRESTFERMRALKLSVMGKGPKGLWDLWGKLLGAWRYNVSGLGLLGLKPNSS